MPPRTQARFCVLINQCAFPGLGTILQRGRYGYAQAALMIAGFSLTMGFLLWYLVSCARYMLNADWDERKWVAHFHPYLWALHYGLALCAVAWLWALGSSIRIWRQAR